MFVSDTCLTYVKLSFYLVNICSNGQTTLGAEMYILYRHKFEENGLITNIFKISVLAFVYNAHAVSLPVSINILFRT